MKYFYLVLLTGLLSANSLIAQTYDPPVTFDDTTINYDLVDFGGNASSIVTDPMGGSNMVARSVKTPGAQLWAGTTMGLNGFASPIPFTAGDTKMRVRVYSPAAGIPIRLKVEDAANGAISVETEDTTTVANAWDVLEFDFTNNMPGTQALNLANTYNKASIFFYFGTDGNNAGADTLYFWDDVEFVPGPPSQVDLPITFDGSNVNYDLADFGGNASAIVADPMGGSNMVVRSVKTPGAQLWAGTTAGNSGLANAIPFTAGDTKMKVRVYSPGVGIPIRLKVEDAANGAISVETEDTTSVANAWDTLTFDFTNNMAGTPALNLANTYNKVSIFFYFGTDGANVGADSVYYWDDVQFAPGGGTQLTQVDLPITFDNSNVNYDLVDFGGNASAMVADPMGGSNMVVRSVKTPGAALWAGTTAGGSGLASSIPFSAIDTRMSVRVYSPAAGIPIRLKVEDAANGAISVETEDTTSVANAWETLTFDFTNNMAGTPALNLANTYDKVSVFFYFGTDGNSVGADSVYFWDDVEFVPTQLAQPDLPITFDDPNVNYEITDFGGNASLMVVDPMGGPNMVVRSVKTPGAQLWAGTTAGGSGLANAIPFTSGDTRMKVRVYSPATGIPVRLKVEDAANGAISVETEVNTTVANAWDTLTFDFNNNVAGTPALNLTSTYDKVSIFFYFGTDGANVGADSVYFWDDVQFAPGGGVQLSQVDLPITFDDTTVNYDLVDFGGNASAIVMDPTGGPNMVTMSTKTAGAQTWAGTTAGGTGLANPIPFAAGETIMKVRVYSPAAGIPIRLKVEDVNDPTISVETEDTTSLANAWDTLTFDFSNEAPGTAAINFANTYNMVSIFFHFGTDGANVGADSTYYWDDVMFVPSTPPLSQIDLPVTFDDPAVDYTIFDFGGTASSVTTDPTGGSNNVGRSVKLPGAQPWAGTIIGQPGLGFANPIPFSAGNTKMRVKVYSPAAGIPVLLKAENSGNSAIAVETQQLTTVANTWETLVFDFTQHASGTPALDLNAVYDVGVIFFYFGTDGNSVGADSVFYWDDVEFGGAVGFEQLEIAELGIYPNPAHDRILVRSTFEVEEITIVNLLGQPVYSERVSGNDISINIEGLQPGKYIIRTRSNDKLTTKKFIKY